MKKAIAIIVLGLLLSSNAHAGLFKKSYEKAIKKGELKIGMTQYELARVFSGKNDDHGPYSKNCGREYYPNSKQEILITESQEIFFVFDNVNNPGAASGLDGKSEYDKKYCSRGDGSLQAYTFSYQEALNLIQDTSNVLKNLSLRNIQIREKMPIYRATCDEAGYERGSEKFSDCVLKQKSEEERVLIEKEKLEVEAKIAKDKQDAEDEKYDDEERERKEKKYKECLKRTSDLYGEPKAYCALELL
jgi:hypothetical protein